MKYSIVEAVAIVSPKWQTLPEADRPAELARMKAVLATLQGLVPDLFNQPTGEVAVAPI